MPISPWPNRYKASQGLDSPHFKNNALPSTYPHPSYPSADSMDFHTLYLFCPDTLATKILISTFLLVFLITGSYQIYLLVSSDFRFAFLPSIRLSDPRSKELLYHTFLFSLPLFSWVLNLGRRSLKSVWIKLYLSVANSFIILYVLFIFKNFLLKLKMYPGRSLHDKCAIQ